VVRGNRRADTRRRMRPLRSSSACARSGLMACTHGRWKAATVAHSDQPSSDSSRPSSRSASRTGSIGSSRRTPGLNPSGRHQAEGPYARRAQETSVGTNAAASARSRQCCSRMKASVSAGGLCTTASDDAQASAPTPSSRPLSRADASGPKPTCADWQPTRLPAGRPFDARAGRLLSSAANRGQRRPAMGGRPSE
jgi:hypothetical protein